MNLNEFKTLLKNHDEKHLLLVLPTGTAVPLSFHVTEIGRVQKTFIDCGGTMRENVFCLLQVWVGGDDDHRLEAGKTAKILEKARSFLSDETMPVEIEYEDAVISQYTISGHEVGADAVVFRLGNKHTDCLAKELCGVPAANKSGAEVPAADACCVGSKTGCC